MKFLVQASCLPSLTAPRTFKDADPLSETGNQPRWGHELLKTGSALETVGNSTRLCRTQSVPFWNFTVYEKKLDLLKHFTQETRTWEFKPRYLLFGLNDAMAIVMFFSMKALIKTACITQLTLPTCSRSHLHLQKVLKIKNSTD